MTSAAPRPLFSLGLLYSEEIVALQCYPIVIVYTVTA